MDNGYYVSSTLYLSLAYCLNRYNFFITKFNETLFGGFAFSSINENLEHLGMLKNPNRGGQAFYGVYDDEKSSLNLARSKIPPS